MTLTLKRCALILVVFVVLAPLAAAQQLRRGDLLVGGLNVPGFCFWVSGQTSHFEWVRDARITRSDPIAVRGAAWSEPATSAFVTIDLTTLARVAADGTLVPLAELPSHGIRPFRAGAIAPDADGNLYVSAEAAVLKFDRDGALLDQIELAPDVPLIHDIDLAADQCTLYVTHRAAPTGRIDVCRKEILADVPSSKGIESVRVLSDGTLLATRFGTTIERIDPATGAILHTYEIPLVETQQRSREAAVRLHSDSLTFTAVIDHGCGFGISFYDYDVAGDAPPAFQYSIFPNTFVTAAIIGEWRAAVPPRRRRLR